MHHFLFEIASYRSKALYVVYTHSLTTVSEQMIHRRTRYTAAHVIPVHDYGRKLLKKRTNGREHTPRWVRLILLQGAEHGLI